MRTELITTKRGRVREFTRTYDSLAELADEVPQLCKGYQDEYATMREWRGNATPNQTLELARMGWTERLAETLTVAQQAVETIERDHEVPVFLPTYDVSGVEVDVSRFLDDEPECMIDYPLTPIVKAGRIITLCASVVFSGAIDPDSIVKRGQAVAALAMALADCGYGFEIWADFSIEAHSGGSVIRNRVLVKGAHDLLDPSKILFALAHPAMSRTLLFGSCHGAPEDMKRDCQVRQGAGYGMPTDARHDLPEGTIYLPSVRSSRDIPDLDDAVIGYLRELEIIQD